MSRMAEKGNSTMVWQDFSHLFDVLQTKFKNVEVEYFGMQKRLKDVLEENLRLQATITSLRKKPCSKCAKLIECTEMLKKKLKEKDDTISVIGKLFVNHNPESYALASQMVNEVITSSAAEGTLLEESVSSGTLDVPNEQNISPKTPKKEEITVEADRKDCSSPVVEKKVRNNKRKFLSISSIKRNKLCDNNVLSNILNDNLNETSSLNMGDKPLNSPENCDKPEDCTPLENPISSPEILSSTSRCDRLSTDNNTHELERTPRRSFLKSRRSLDMKFANVGKEKVSSPEVDMKPVEIMVQPFEETKNSEPMDMEIMKAIEPLPPAESNQNDEKLSNKRVWNLKKSRELTNKKLKQTVLSTVVFEKKVDISTSNEYQGGSIPLNAKKQDTESRRFVHKENNDETFFEPIITSTHNDYESTAQPAPTKAALVESTNKPRTPSKIEDSFDCIPSTSPKYKYKRDAVRKKSERMKLPGQECAKCMDFYGKTDYTNSQLRKVLNKCSRHRDKFPVHVYTPPGLWNPVFDDTDDEVEVK